ncbi:dolichyl-phosphate-mannose--protein mannosyltransferase [Cellulomonas marina]|uniref:Polyprenol-phosphate-mannose--protein mannosyltransferase n=1 Tax=Cellulomonas marina TaxID=988821 RepID=A0A1I0X6W3_9CELL|nr:phospholipid carrier-dependent glycosyltransferase [Cellulomonas marina]GIG28955.1 dolichyl-phosphate-mannose--protein mannosyltransferase [Cellulomonas marina]SFA96090.1 Dolichyl-phosphate-mannose-protein mannosyltransferase [Cellulomonas marina]
MPDETPGPAGPWEPTPARASAPTDPDERAAEHDGAAVGTAVEATGSGADTPVEPDPVPTRDRLLLRLLGPATLALGSTHRDRVLGWVGPLAVTALAAVLRLWHLGTPDSLVFDETYYVKDGYALTQLGYEGQWGEDPNPSFEAGDTSGLSTAGEYVVHPPVGKWLIGLGIRLGGVEHPWAWRLSAAVAGVLAVLVLARVARRLLASTALGTLAGLLLAVDGMAIVFSRTSLLDGFLMLFLLCGFGCLVVDREVARRRLADRADAVLDAGGRLGLGPRLGFRGWRLAAAVLLGLAVATKWSALWFVALFGLMTVLWDALARRAVGVRAWAWAGVWRDGVVASLVVVGTTVAVYVASWSGWLLTAGGYGRQWAADHPGEGLTWLPEGLRSLVQYHVQMWSFHTGLTTPHTYQAHPLGWLVQWRPTLFFYDQDLVALSPQDALAACGAERCTSAVTSLGNPLTWWLGTAACVVALVLLLRWRDWRAGAALAGVAAGWLPWFAYSHRTIFAFYAIALLPFLVLVLVHVLGVAVGPRPAPDETAAARSRRLVVRVVAGLVVLVVAVSAFFYPVWTAWTVPFSFWHWHVWMPGWT